MHERRLRVTLPLLDARIDARVASTLSEHPYWPCQKGCDHCCRSLPHLPRVSLPEWERMRAAIEALPESIAEEVRAGIRSQERTAKVTCPLLDRASGACRIYDARPIACRTYGFYTERDAGLHCSLVTAAIEAHLDQPVTWGNGEALARELDTLGEPRSLAAWLDPP